MRKKKYKSEDFVSSKLGFSREKNKQINKKHEIDIVIVLTLILKSWSSFPTCKFGVFGNLSTSLLHQVFFP